MEIFGKRGLGNILKILLQFVLVLGILILISFPIILRFTNISINPNIILFYPNAICLLLIIYQFIGLFDSLKKWSIWEIEIASSDRHDKIDCDMR